MRILIVAATSIELNPIKAKGINSIHELDFLITGVGMTATAYHLGVKLAQNKYDLAINIGLAGAFNKEITLGEVVNVISDQLAEEGAEDGDDFLSVIEMGLRNQNESPFNNGQLNTNFSLKSTDIINYREVRGITVNKVHGNDLSIQKAQNLFKPDVESMEGAAFLYACLSSGIQCVQIRAISNYVERRDRSKWKVEIALNNLAKELKAFLDSIS